MALSKAVEELTLGSDTEKRDFCVACAVDGEYRPAVKFCLDCRQQICQTCVDSHRRIKLIQGHKLVDTSNEEAIKVADTLSSCIACPNHTNKNIEFICLDHDAFCCPTCATVNHRTCRHVEEVAALAQNSPDIPTIMKHLNDAKEAIEGIVKLRHKNNTDIQEQVSKIIPKQIQKMKASIMKTFDDLEHYLLRETKGLAESLRDYPVDNEIVRWQSQMKTINETSSVLSSVQQHGADVHKYVTARNTERKLAGIDNSIHQANYFNLDNLSFSFDRMLFLRNASVAVNTITKSLAEIGENAQPNYRPSTKPRGKQQRSLPINPVKTNSFARLFTKTTAVETPFYPHGQSIGGITHRGRHFPSTYTQPSFKCDNTGVLEFFQAGQPRALHFDPDTEYDSEEAYDREYDEYECT